MAVSFLANSDGISDGITILATTVSFLANSDGISDGIRILDLATEIATENMASL